VIGCFVVTGTIVIRWSADKNEARSRICETITRWVWCCW